ncbi:Homeobox-leucine zipper protein ATHB-14 [Platanthera guangdongensis]|uniref:Homeobox-leucine zipper protein ATHB-14 n=1 Tax=Platanthera guangdongensis TaxID=2320717 RepID=A0ABR2LXR4_9ASPA
MGRAVSYKQVAAWKVLNEEDAHHCLAFMFIGCGNNLGFAKHTLFLTELTKANKTGQKKPNKVQIVNEFAALHTSDS